MGDPHRGPLGHDPAAGGPPDPSVTDQPSRNRERNLKIARNEAMREARSDMRLAAWAVSLALVLALSVAFYLLTR